MQLVNFALTINKLWSFLLTRGTLTRFAYFDSSFCSFVLRPIQEISCPPWPYVRDTVGQILVENDRSSCETNCHCSHRDLISITDGRKVWKKNRKNSIVTPVCCQISALFPCSVSRNNYFSCYVDTRCSEIAFSIERLSTKTILVHVFRFQKIEGTFWHISWHI